MTGKCILWRTATATQIWIWSRERIYGLRIKVKLHFWLDLDYNRNKLQSFSRSLFLACIGLKLKKGDFYTILPFGRIRYPFCGVFAVVVVAVVVYFIPFHLISLDFISRSCSLNKRPYIYNLNWEIRDWKKHRKSECWLWKAKKNRRKKHIKRRLHHFDVDDTHR